VGAQLFERLGGPRPVRLTAVGEALVVHARAVVARLHAAQADVAALVAGEHGALRVGILQSVGTKVLPRLLRRSREELPGIDLLPLEPADHLELAAGIEAGRLDLSFAPLPVGEGPFAIRRLLNDPYVFVAPATADEARLESVTLRQIARLPLIGVRDEQLLAEVLGQLRRTGIEPSFVFHSNDNPTIQGCVAAGLGYAVLPRLTVDEDDPEIAVLRISSTMPPRRIGVVWHVDRQLPPAVPRLVELAAEVCDAVMAEWVAADAG
jgi:DNA-binding transcriptional LysR family regulator